MLGSLIYRNMDDAPVLAGLAAASVLVPEELTETMRDGHWEHCQVDGRLPE